MTIAEEYNRRVIDVRTRLIHASTLTKHGHYDYVDELACDAHINRDELFQQPEGTMVTCLACVAVV